MKLFDGIHVVSVSVTDLVRARIFYSETLGLGEPVLDLVDADWIEFSTGGAEGGNLSVILASPGWEPSTGTTVVLNVGDCHAIVDELRCRGVACGDPVTHEGRVTTASFHDPFGNRLQIRSQAG